MSQDQSTKPPREWMFHIHDGPDPENDIQSSQAWITTADDPAINDFMREHWTHVIEKSAYDELLAVLKHPWLLEELSCGCGYYGEDNEETGMSECPYCAIKRVLKAHGLSEKARDDE